MQEKINISCTVKKGAIVPEYKTAGAAGADVCAFLEESVTLAAGKRVLVPTGLSFEIPEGYEIQVRPRKQRELYRLHVHRVQCRRRWLSP